jgi:RNA polymerase sigma-70 factor, ECF subfamily
LDAGALYREHFGRAVGVLARSLRDLDLAEEAVQDAFTTALDRWPRDGVPDDPGAWIIRAARNRAIDILRRRRVAADRELQAAERTAREGPPVEEELGDERLALLFACCHPDLPPEGRVALTLRLVAGLTVEEIARALLTGPEAVAQRIVRAKRRLRERGVSLAVPPPAQLGDRAESVLATLYLTYNEGAATTAGDDPARGELCAEAIRLTRLLVRLLPDEPEGRGLLALLLLTEARRPARLDDGRYVPLAEHDRTCYGADLIDEGDTLVRSALGQVPGRYAIEAAISALHSTAASFDETDWPQIAALYGVLQTIAGNPVVALNGAVAISYADGPNVALPLLDALAPDLATFGPYYAARADVLRRLGRTAEAVDAYREALAHSGNAAERALLAERLRALQPARP